MKDKWGNVEGSYTFQGIRNGMGYWLHSEGELAIWYEELGQNYYWLIGKLNALENIPATTTTWTTGISTVS